MKTKRISPMHPFEPYPSHLRCWYYSVNLMESYEPHASTTSEIQLLKWRAIYFPLMNSEQNSVADNEINYFRKTMLNIKQLQSLLDFSNPTIEATSDPTKDIINERPAILRSNFCCHNNEPLILDVILSQLKRYKGTLINCNILTVSEFERVPLQRPRLRY